MASGQKLLIDTNVLIGLEDWKEIPPSFAELQNLCSKHGHRLYVHEAAVSDISRDVDVSRRKVTLSKLGKFERLAGIKTPSEAALSAKFGKISKANDLVDVALLFALDLGAADFLVTEDQGIHARARRVGSAFADRVLTVAEAVEWLVVEHEPKAVRLPLVEERPAHAIDPGDPIFESLREGYPGFDNWWRTKCIPQHRLCWVVTVGGVLAGIIVRKDETANVGGASRKVLKLCTFKVAPEFRGEKLGELLLKQALWFAQHNGYDSVYLTTYPEQAVLVAVLEYFGFVRSGPDQSGELRLEKTLSTEKLTASLGDNVFDVSRLGYPRFVAPPSVRVFCIPIRGEYHDMLFPELADRRQADLFEGMGETSRPRTPGNTIRKIYLCKANSTKMEAGSVILFYRSASSPSPLSQSITTLGIVERVVEPPDADGLVRLTAKRSVYTASQLAKMIEPEGRPVKAIDFLLVGHLATPMRLEELQRLGLFGRHPPQSVSQLSAEKFDLVRPHLQFGFSV